MHINTSSLTGSARSVAADIETQQSTADGTATPVYWFLAGVGVMAAAGGAVWLVHSCQQQPSPAASSEELEAEVFGPGVGKPPTQNFFFPGPGEEDWTMASAIVGELAAVKQKAIALPKERFREFEALEKEAGWLLNSLIYERPKKAAAFAAAGRIGELLVEMKKLTEAPEVDVVAAVRDLIAAQSKASQPAKADVVAADVVAAMENLIAQSEASKASKAPR